MLRPIWDQASHLIPSFTYKLKNWIKSLTLVVNLLGSSQKHRSIPQRKFLMMILFLFFALTALADTSCEPEVRAQCLSKPFECLNNTSLPQNCRDELKRLLLIKKQSMERGGGALTSFGGFNAIGPQIPMAGYDGYFANRIENRLSVSPRLYQSETDSLGLTFSVAQTHFYQPLKLDDGENISSTWSRFEISSQYSYKTLNKKSWSFKGALGYAGDSPSTMPKDLSFSFMMSYGFEGSGTDYWVLLVMVANNSQFANFVPLPGFIYIHRTKTLTGLFGFPILSLQWTPSAQSSYSLSLFGLNAQAEYAYGDDVRYFINYSYLIQSYIPANRAEDRDRFNIHEQKFGPGIRLPVNKTNRFEAQTGYSFDRENFMSTSVFKRDGGSTHLDPGWFVALSLKSLF